MRSAKVVSIIVGVIALILAGWVAYLLLGRQEVSRSGVTDFASCVAAGNPVTQTSPQQCRTVDGTVYSEPGVAGDGGANATVREFTSPKGVTVRLHDWAERHTVTSPLAISGEIPGNWSFEASFPIVLLDPTGKIIGQTTAALDGEWMTSNYVPFTATLTFEAPSAGGSGILTLRKDNPSGLPENDDAIEIPVTFSTGGE
jgi:hypothetical protein